MERQNTRSLWKQAFFSALLAAALIFLPFVLYDKGYFIYYGDFNVQQIPFYKLAHEAVRSGDIFWNWYTDLGANFIGSYSFYLLFSPFFWLTLPFPTSALPFLMAPLLVLKTACASLTAYLYLERFVKDKGYAVLGALLYAFSGWMTFNIFFNHFHEAAVFFPLLPLAVEKLVTEDKKLFFAVAVAVNAMVNYWFFAGEAVFMILYVFVRMSDKSFGMTVRKFSRVAFEALLGVLMAAFAIVPSVMALAGNPRTGLTELATGWNAWLYWHEQRQPAILASILFPPDLPARPNFLPDHGAKWASLSAWLPMFGVTGVLAYFFSRKNDWLKKILAVCLLFSLVPWLNSLFILLNNSYYARWFYMPVLLMAMACVRALEEAPENKAHFYRAVKWSGILIAAFALMCGATPRFEDNKLVFGLAKDLPLMWVYAGMALLGLLLTALLALHLRKSRRFLKLATLITAAFAVAFSIFYIACGRAVFERDRFVIDTAINGRQEINLPEEPFARSDAYDAQDNLLMFWRLPNIQAFHSIVPASVMEFYPEVGVTRDVGSRPEAEFFALRPLLSVRWLFVEKDKTDESPMPGYERYGEQAGFVVYENRNFLPMGFSYDKYVTREALENVEKNKRSNMMLKAVVLDEETISRNLDILEQVDITGGEQFDYPAMERDVRERREFCADSFSFDTRGFSAVTDFQSERLVFFSVPFEKGWSASVNGESAIIERANIGFMAVRVPAGRAEIRFDYFTPGLREGMAVSAVAILLFMILFMLSRVLKKRPSREMVTMALFNGQTVTLSMKDYRRIYGDMKRRRDELQRAINNKAATEIPEALPEDEITFDFEAAGEVPEDGETGNDVSEP